jgi:hypothetical protein
MAIRNGVSPDANARIRLIQDGDIDAMVSLTQSTAPTTGSLSPSRVTAFRTRTAPLPATLP